MNKQPTYKVVLCGPTNGGKTSFVSHVLCDEIPEEHIPTLGVEVHPLRRSNCVMNVWDVAGDDRFGGLHGGIERSTGRSLECPPRQQGCCRKGYFAAADAAVVFVPLHKRVQEWSSWKRWVEMLPPTLPRILVLSKDDFPSPFDERDVVVRYAADHHVPCLTLSLYKKKGVQEVLQTLESLLVRSDTTAKL